MDTLGIAQSESGVSYVHHHHHHLFAQRRYSKTSEDNSTTSRTTRRNNTHLQNAPKYTITQVRFTKCLYNIDCIKKIGKITNIAINQYKPHLRKSVKSIS